MALLYKLSPTSLDVRDRDIIEIDDARGTVVEDEPRIGRARGEIGIDRAERGPIEPGLRMPGARLVILHHDTIPGIGT